MNLLFIKSKFLFCQKTFLVTKISISAINYVIEKNEKACQMGVIQVTEIPIQVEDQKEIKKLVKDYHSNGWDKKLITSSPAKFQQQLFLQAAFLSQHDKARVPTGTIPAVAKQTPLLMHMTHRVRLIDRDWMVTERHKHIPSVHAEIVMKPNMMVSVLPRQFLILYQLWLL